MSDLKHMTLGELRQEISSISSWRARKEAEADDLDRRAEDMRKTASELRSRSHNMGQREAWARIYLAQKT